MKRILLFVHYNKYAGLSDHIIYLLDHIKHIYSRTIFISNSQISDKQRDKLTGLYDALLIRENKGFDFGAWKDALLQEGWDKLSKYDSVTLINDTCFGPIFELEPIYINMEARQVDFWGLTKHRKTARGMPGTNKAIPEHLQSYFLCFNKNVIQSPIFQNFWKNVSYETDVYKVIQEYETRLTSILTQSRFRYATFGDISDIKNINHEDIATYHPDICMKARIPLVKIKSFIHFSFPKYIIKFIKENTGYPISFIHDYFTEIYDPNTSLLICDKLVSVRTSIDDSVDGCCISSLLKVAIHLHVFYLDVFEQYIARFDNYSINFDLFITTDTPDKKKYIENYMKEHTSKIKEIIIIENRGRDIFPWLCIGNRLDTYDVAGHFHTKHTETAKEIIGITWQQELFDLLINPIDTIIKTFYANKNIGIIIPDIPYFFSKVSPLKFLQEKDMQIIMNNLWERMCCKKQIDFTKLLTAIMPCGTMFWYRPKALTPLFQLSLSPDDIPAEPLLFDRTILHCIERMPVYIAWNEGYDYRISVPETPQTSLFTDNILLNKQCIEIEEIKQSKTYRVGEFMLAIPKKIRDIFLKSR